MNRFLLTTLLVLLCAAGHAASQSTAFTYQGNLTSNGQPVNGEVDLTFKLFDAATVGNQVGPSILMTSFPVVNGRFTADLNFPGAFLGKQTWLEVTVGTQVLSPREQVDTVPVAQYALQGSPAKFLFASNTTNSGTAVRVGNYNYTPSCTVTGSGNAISAKLFFYFAPVVAQTYNLYGIQHTQQNDTGAVSTSTASFPGLTGTRSYSVTGTNGAISRTYLSIILTDDAQTVQTWNLRISANSSATLGTGQSRCMAEGTIVPGA